MTGSPLLRLALVLGILALLAVPAWRLTGREAPPPAPAPVTASTPSATDTTEVAFTAATAPEQLDLDVLGKTIYTVKPNPGDYSSGFVISAQIPLPAAETDLVIRAKWSGTQAMNALRLQVGSEQDYRMDTTLWGEPQIEDVIILPQFPRR